MLLSVSHIQQRRPGECLAACAAMVLTYLGLSISYARLLRLLRVKPGIGAPASNIRELEQLGIDVVYQQGTLTELRQHLMNNIPCIVFVKTDELPYWDQATDHAVVITGFDDKYVYLNDPEFPDAPMQVSHGDFDLAWLGRDEFYTILTRLDR